MLLLRTDAWPADAARWDYQLKLDGYRAVAFKTNGALHLRSRNDNDFSRRYPGVVSGLAKLPNETVIDGEVIAPDEDGRPSFNVLQNHASGASVQYFVFDIMILGGRDLRREALETRRDLLERRVLPKLGGHCLSFGRVMPLQSNRFSVFGSLGRFVSGILRIKIVTPTAQTIATAIPAIHIVMVAVWASNGPRSN